MKNGFAKRSLIFFITFCLVTAGVPFSAVAATGSDFSALGAEAEAGFTAHFECGEGASVTTYDTQDLTQQGTEHAESALARDSSTGEVDASGDGQVNFTVTVQDGYELKGVSVTPSENYKNFKTNDDGSYRITKMKGDVTVTITTAKTTEECDHVFGEWETVQEAKCETAGLERRVCSLCQAEEQREIPALGHTYVDDKCSKCGKISPDAVVALSEIDFHVSANAALGLDGDVHVALTSSGSGYAGTVFLPGSASVSDLSLEWDPSNSVTVKTQDGTAYASGSAPLAAASSSVTYNVTCGDNSATFTFSTIQGSESVAGMFLTIDESLGTIDAMNSDPDHNTSCYGGVGFDGANYNMVIKGRGNWTWSAGDKKPYGITLYSDGNYSTKQKAELIDGVKSSKWTLLANYADGSLMRNKISYDLASKLGIGVDSRYVDIWMNGEYVGNYLMTAKTDYDVSTDGYMLELDNNYDTEDPYFALDGLEPYNSTANVITVKKVGNSAEASGLTTNDIQSWMQDMLDALRDTSSEEYLNYIDVDSWAKLYLIQEYSKNHDILAGSILMHRDGLGEGDKLIAGPAWDFDVAWSRVFCGTNFGISSSMHQSADGWYIDAISGCTSFLQYLGMHESFMTRVYEVFNEYRDAFSEVSSEIDSLQTEISASAEMNYRVWNVTQTQYNATYFSQTTTRGSGTYAFTQVATRSWSNYVTNLKAYVDARFAFLSDSLTVEQPTGALIENESDGKDILSVELTSDPQNVTCQWQASTDGGTWTSIDGAESANYDISNAPFLSYRCLVRNNGSAINTTSVAKVATSNVLTLTRDGQDCFAANFACDEHSSVTVFDTQDVTAKGTPNAQYVVARNSDTGEIDASGDGQINFTVQTETGWNIKEVAVTPAGSFKNLKVIDEANGVYRVTKVTGPLTITVTTKECEHEYENGYCKFCGKEEFSGHIDLTDPESAKYLIIENQTSTAIREGKGLYLVSTKNAFEPCNGQLSGTAATTPKDVVKIEAKGNWTATAKVDFAQNSSAGYYEFFGFYAMDDYQNLAGIRAGDKTIQNFLRQNGTITAETSGMTASPGLKSASTHWLRITKTGDDYDCYWSTDGENFTKIFSLVDTGIDGGTLVLDAYSGMAVGYEYLVEYVDIACNHEWETTTVPATCFADGYVLNTCKFCGKTTRETIPATGVHSFDESGTCSVCGSTYSAKAYTSCSTGQAYMITYAPSTTIEQGCATLNGSDMVWMEDEKCWATILDSVPRSFNDVFGKDEAASVNVIDDTGTAEEKIATRGDLNNNGRLNIVDAQIAFEISNGLYDATPNSLMILRADVNRDYYVDSSDARAIQCCMHGSATE